MKRLVVCCDGTWNGIDAERHTNVLQLARAVEKVGEDGIEQVLCYVEGVGTGTGSTWLTRTIDRLGGGAFGWGLNDNIEACYRFLVFNHQPGDQIFIFGFSRGAYTARSLAGFIRTCSIIKPDRLDRLDEAMALYRRRDSKHGPDSRDLLEFRASNAPHLHTSGKDLAWRRLHFPCFSDDKSLRLRITYLGIWDTVGALGIPNHFAIARFFNGKYTFHDTALSSSVVSARHAVAIDERRTVFEPTLWNNLDELMRRSNTAGRANAPYQQQWFPGDHSCIGGGGTNETISSETLRWIAEGARAKGLSIDKSFSDSLERKRSHLGPLTSSPGKSNTFFGSLTSLVGTGDREGPDALRDVSSYARLRWGENPARLPRGKAYRPSTLCKVAGQLADAGVVACTDC